MPILSSMGRGRSAVTLAAVLAAAVLLAPLPAGGQGIRVASYNVKSLGTGEKDYVALGRILAHFDVVAAEGTMTAGGVEKVMGVLADGWEAALGRRPGPRGESFGFFYNDRVTLVSMLGEYPVRGKFARPPLAAQFKVKGARLLFNLVACWIDDRGQGQRAEIDRLADVYRYFEKLTGNRGVTIIAGDFNDERMNDFRALRALGSMEIVPSKPTALGARDPDRDYDHIFVNEALRSHVQGADVFYWTRDFDATRRSVSDHFPVYVVLGAR